jgi:hypothetical protein
MERLKLKPAFVPVPLWKRSVCNVLGVKRKPWRTLRQEVIDAAASMCEYCGESYEKGMICHEVWEYDDQSHIATLNAFVLACRDCNFVLHAGLALEVGFRQEATGKGSTAERGNQAVSHLSKVNSISESEAQRILTLAFRQHSERSRHRWEIRIASEMVEKYPVLNGLQL